ncbi:MAG: ferredoxin reductase [Candidatus Dormiibacterota bacterium]
MSWQPATVVEVITETARVKSIVLELETFPRHRPGQHVDVRLTAPDGYQAQRSYSIASAPEDDRLVLTVERLEDGEVSSYLAGELRPGDQFDLRGPVGGYFVWDGSVQGPVLLVAGGSAVVPFRSMLRHRAAVRSTVAVRMLYSSRSLDDVIYRQELIRLAADEEVDIRLALTREWPEGWSGRRGRIDRELLEEVSWPAADEPLFFICGPSGFAESIANALVQNGQAPGLIRIERFGPTGT